MPMHDWKRIDPNVYHDFHQSWAMAIRNRLNSGMLPHGFSALVEQHAIGLVPDVLAVERRSKIKKRSFKGGTTTLVEPRTRLKVESTDEALVRRASRFAIRHRLGDVVCIIEIVSPGNKSSKFAIKSFVDKSSSSFAAGSTCSSSIRFRRRRAIPTASTNSSGSGSSNTRRRLISFPMNRS